MATVLAPATELDLSDYEALCGRDVALPEQANYEVTRDRIREAAYLIHDTNALYLDDDFAGETRWRGIIAMPGFLYGYCQLNYSLHLGRVTDNAGVIYEEASNMGADWEFLRTVRPGDSIVARQRPLSAVAKRGSRMGLFALLTAESQFINQRGELVAIARQSNARWSKARQSERGRMAGAYERAGLTPQAPEPVVIPPDRTHPIHWTDSGPRRYDRHSVYFEDVAEGMELPPDPMGPMTEAHRLAGGMLIGSSWRFGRANPVLVEGLVPIPYFPGVLTIAWFGTMLTHWAGPNSWIRRLSYQNVEWIMVGYAYVRRGSVVRKYIEDGKHLIDCELRIESEAGFVTRRGSATIELPTRRD